MNKQILLTLKIIVSGILLSYLFTIIPFSEIISSIESANIILVLIGIILATPISYLSALETQYLTRIQEMSLTVFEIMKIHLATSFYGLFLPGILSGGVIKWYKFSKHGNKSSAVAVVVFNRFLETLMIILLGIFFSFPALFILGKQGLITVWILLFLFMFALYFSLLNKSVLNFADKILFKILPTLAGLNIVKEKIRKFIDAMHQFQNLRLKDHFEIFGLLLLYHGIGLLSFYCFAKSLNINLSIWEIGWIRSAMSIAIMLPMSFAGLGIREGTLVFLFGQYGVLPNDSMALSFLFFFRNLLTAAIGGLFEFKEFAFSKKIEEINSVKIIDDN